MPRLCRPGERPDPLQERVRTAAGTAIQAAPRPYRLVRPARRNQRGVLAAATIRESGRRDQAYGPLERSSRVLHQTLTKNGVDRAVVNRGVLDDLAVGAGYWLGGVVRRTHTFIGEGIGTLFERAVPEGASRDDRELVARCMEGFRQTYGRGWNVATRPYPGIPELLNILVSRSLGLAVLSNKPDAFTRQCVEAYLGRWPFQAVFGDREGVPRKPDPAGAVEAAGRLGVSPGAILYLGDSSVDMATARRAGMIPVGAAWGFRTEEELRASGAVKVIAHPLELVDFLENGEQRP